MNVVCKAVIYVSNADRQKDVAVILNGVGDGAKQCISVASNDVKLEDLPEIKRLAGTILTEAEHSESGGGQRGKSVRVIRKADLSPGQESNKSRKKRLPVKRIAAMSFLVIVMGLIALVVFEAGQINQIADSINYINSGISFDKVELMVSESEMAGFVSHSDETTNILLAGCDIDAGGVSRTDSMIILTVDHAHRKIKMTSLMRDMYLTIPGYGKSKLNAAFVFGGGDLLLKTVYSNFGIKIDRFVCVDYAVFASVVDNLGGVEIDIEEMELEQFNKYVRGKDNRLTKAGRYHFNGQQALSYCRIRKVGTDTARTARQRKVLGEIMKKCRTLSPMEAQNILSVVAPYITTNMSRDEMTQMVLEGLNCLSYDTMGLRIPMDGAWTDKKIGSVWYVQADLNANARYIHHFIYGDDESAFALVNRQQKDDERKAQSDRAAYEKKISDP